MYDTGLINATVPLVVGDLPFLHCSNKEDLILTFDILLTFDIHILKVSMPDKKRLNLSLI